MVDKKDVVVIQTNYPSFHDVGMSTGDTTVVTTRINAALRAKLEALARSTKRSKSFLAAEAIAAYVELNEWQIGEITAGIGELEFQAKLCPINRLRSGITGCCSHGEASSPRIRSPAIFAGSKTFVSGSRRKTRIPASRMIQRIRAAVMRLAASPALGRPGRVADTRELVITRTPYIVPYRITGDVVQIITILHSAQRWPDGLP